MATPERRGGGIGGISLGGILVIIGIVVALFWSLVVGLIIVLIGLIAFGGFARAGGIETSVEAAGLAGLHREGE